MPGGSRLPDSVLQRCGPYEPGTMTLVGLKDQTHFSYRPPGRDPPRLPVPGELVGFRQTTGQLDRPTGVGIVISVCDEGHVYGPAVVVLWSVIPRAFQAWDPQGL